MSHNLQMEMTFTGYYKVPEKLDFCSINVTYMLQNVYIFCRFDEVSCIIKPRIMTFSQTVSHIFCADFVVSTTAKQYTEYQHTVYKTTLNVMVYSLVSVYIYILSLNFIFTPWPGFQNFFTQVICLSSLS